MDIEPIVKQVSTFANKAYEVGTATVVWCGHTIKEGYYLYGIPAAEKISAFSILAFHQVQNLILLGPGKIFACAAGWLLVGAAAFKMADKKANEENLFAKSVWKALGIASFVNATALTSLGMFTILAI